MSRNLSRSQASRSLWTRLLSGTVAVAFFTVQSSLALAQNGPIVSHLPYDMNQALRSIEKTRDLLASKGFSLKQVDVNADKASFRIGLPEKIFPALAITAAMVNKDNDHVVLQIHAECTNDQICYQARKPLDTNLEILPKYSPAVPTSRDELTAQEWNAADADHNGRVSSDEFSTYIEKLKKEIRHVSSVQVELTKSDRPEDVAANAAALEDQLSLFANQITSYYSNLIKGSHLKKEIDQKDYYTKSRGYKELVVGAVMALAGGGLAYVNLVGTSRDTPSGEPSHPVLTFLARGFFFMVGVSFLVSGGSHIAESIKIFRAAGGPNSVDWTDEELRQLKETTEYLQP